MGGKDCLGIVFSGYRGCFGWGGICFGGVWFGWGGNCFGGVWFGWGGNCSGLVWFFWGKLLGFGGGGNDLGLDGDIMFGFDGGLFGGFCLYRFVIVIFEGGFWWVFVDGVGGKFGLFWGGMLVLEDVGGGIFFVLFIGVY